MVKRPKGIVRIFSRGALVWECRNLFVNAGLPALANLMAGVTSGQYALTVGFGSGGAAARTNERTGRAISRPWSRHDASGDADGSEICALLWEMGADL